MKSATAAILFFPVLVLGADIKDPGPNKLDEPKAKTFSVAKAVEFLDNASLLWQKEKQCFSCHTNNAYLFVRPLAGQGSEAEKQVRAAAEELVLNRWKEKGPRWDAEVVAMAASLALHDKLTTGKLHDTTRLALDRMWQVQKPDGGWSWLKCNWPPMESDDHYGATLAVLAVGFAPEDYAKTPQAIEGLAKARGYFNKNPPLHLHHQAMLLWGDSYFPGLISPELKEKTIRALRELQLADGGWSASALGNYKRADNKEQNLMESDGYGTAFSLLVLRKAGLPANEPAIQKGISWLKGNQRESGRWFTRSLNRDNRHYLTHAGTAFALFALAECGELKPNPLLVRQDGTVVDNCNQRSWSIKGIRRVISQWRSRK